MAHSPMPVEAKAEIKQASASDRDAIWDFIKTAYPNNHRYMIPDRWIWQYADNPNIDSITGKLPVWIAVKNSAIVGQLCVIPVVLKAGDEMHHAVWGVDLIVLPSCRGEGIGQRLIQAVVEQCQFYMAVGMSATTKRIYDRLGYPDLAPVGVYRRIVQLSPALVSEYLEKLGKSKLWLKGFINPAQGLFQLDRVLASSLNVTMTLRNFFFRRGGRRLTREVREVQQFDESIDELWRKVHHQYDVIVKRDRAFLNWRYTAHKQLDYRLFVALRNGSVTGYSVLRRSEPIERNFGHIVDLFSAKDDIDTISSLIEHAIEFFGDSVEVVEFACTSEEYQAVLKKAGFIRMSEAVPYFYCTNTPRRDRSKIKTAHWFITSGDSDWDQLNPREVKP